MAIQDNRVAGPGIEQALSLQRAGRVADAITACRAVAASAAGIDAPLLLALLLDQRGSPDEALAWADEAIRRQPGAAPAHGARGRVLARAGQFDDAAVALEQALRLNSEFADARAVLAVVRRRQGAALHASGRAAFQAGRFAAAADALGRAAGLVFDDATIHHDHAAALHAAGDARGAMAAFGRALALDPCRVETWHDLGSARQAVGDLPGAMAAYGRAYRLDPASFARIAQELAAGNPGRVWLEAADLRRALEAAAIA